MGRRDFKPYLIEEELESFYSDKRWSLEEFRAILNKIEQQVPVENRDSIVIEFVTGDYDESSRHLDIKYKRMMTDEENQKRILSALKHVEIVRAEEKAEFERLKQKFGG